MRTARLLTCAVQSKLLMNSWTVPAKARDAAGIVVWTAVAEPPNEDVLTPDGPLKQTDVVRVQEADEVSSQDSGQVRTANSRHIGRDGGDHGGYGFEGGCGD